MEDEAGMSGVESEVLGGLIDEDEMTGVERDAAVASPIKKGERLSSKVCCYTFTRH
jgi:hypothetical protein